MYAEGGNPSHYRTSSLQPPPLLTINLLLTVLLFLYSLLLLIPSTTYHDRSQSLRGSILKRIPVHYILYSRLLPRPAFARSPLQSSLLYPPITYTINSAISVVKHYHPCSNHYLPSVPPLSVDIDTTVPTQYPLPLVITVTVSCRHISYITFRRNLILYPR
jgi:hypothetical protein